MVNQLPKVLIVGQFFDQRTGTGITLSNLFKGWPIEKLAVAARDIKMPNYSVCNNYYQLGRMENRRIFPFNLRNGENIAQSGCLPKFPIKHDPKAYSTERKHRINLVYERLLKYTGFVHRNRELYLSSELRKWINEFSPDLIYSQLSSLELIRFVDELISTFNIPLVIHIMDDWPKIISRKGLFKHYWERTIDKEFRVLLGKAKILLSISEAMSNQYFDRYGKTFIPFHNPIDVGFWINHCKKDYKAADPFIILYTGRIGTGVSKCLQDLAYAINNLNCAGSNIEFHIQTISDASALRKSLNEFKFVKFNKPSPYEELPSVLGKADILTIPNDFSSESIHFLKYSMPTKASEYMISGTPILVYSSSLTAVARHAELNGWAMVVAERNLEKLEKAIAAYYKNEDLRKEFGARAFKYACQNYDGELIRKQFRETICSVDRTLDG